MFDISNYFVTDSTLDSSNKMRERKLLFAKIEQFHSFLQINSFIQFKFFHLFNSIFINLPHTSECRGFDVQIRDTPYTFASTEIAPSAISTLLYRDIFHYLFPSTPVKINYVPLARSENCPTKMLSLETPPAKHKKYN